MRARDQSSIFSTGGKFRPDYGLLLELHALTLVARSYALLVTCIDIIQFKVHSFIATVPTQIMHDMASATPMVTGPHNLASYPGRPHTGSGYGAT